MIDMIHESVVLKARDAAIEWIKRGGDVDRWNRRIAGCWMMFSCYSRKEVQDIFEMERDEIYASLPHEDDNQFDLTTGAVI